MLITASNGVSSYSRSSCGGLHDQVRAGACATTGPQVGDAWLAHFVSFPTAPQDFVCAAKLIAAQGYREMVTSGAVDRGSAYFLDALARNGRTAPSLRLWSAPPAGDFENVAQYLDPMLAA